MNAINERYDQILVATDFSSSAAVAVRGAAQLARAWGARVELVHATLPDRYAADVIAGSEAELGKRIEAQALRELAAVRDDVFAGVEVTLRTLEGTSPATAIVEYAKSSGAKLCVVGTHGRTGLSRMLIGSVAETVVRQAATDVLCIPPTSDLSALPPRRIVAPSDFSDTAGAGIQVAASLARTNSASLTLLHVLDVVHAAVPAAAYAVGELDMDAIRGQLVKYRDTQLSDLPEVAIEVLLNASAADSITRLATDWPAHMVVMASHGRTGFARLMIGSVAERVSRHAPCPTLVVRVASP